MPESATALMHRLHDDHAAALWGYCLRLTGSDRARAEDVRAKGAFDVVTARAVSALRTLIPLTAPLVRDGGELTLLKGMNAANEIEAARKQIAKFTLSDVRVEVLGEGLLPETTRVVRAHVR